MWRLYPVLIGLMLGGWSGEALAGLQLVPAPGPLAVFAGENREIQVVWHNDGTQAMAMPLEARVLQASSATVMPVSSRRSQLQALPGQTVVSTVRLDFPLVRAGTKFLVQWLDNSQRVAGVTEVWVYPDDQLAELKRWLPDAGNQLGVLDATGGLRAVLNQQAIPYVNLAESDLDRFSGHLLLLASGPASAGTTADWAERIRLLAARGVAVVWICAQPENREPPWPSYFLVAKSKAAVLVAQPALLADLPANPAAQRNLIYFCKLALDPASPTLPTRPLKP